MRNAAAMTTMGIITAMAIFPPELRPPLPPDPLPEALNADAVDEELEVLLAVSLEVRVTEVSPGCVEVTTTTEREVLTGAVVGVCSGVKVVV